MSSMQEFTDDELSLLASTPTLIGSAMAFAEGSGLATIKELMESASSYLGAIKDYPDNRIIRSIMPNLEDRKQAMAEAKAFRDKTVDRLREKQIDSHEKIRAMLLEDCRAINKLLAVKAAPGEAVEYKEWALSVAENVARAAKEGGFLGFGGERVSEGEREFFAELAEALDVRASID